jgi:hypothetical protein
MLRVRGILDLARSAYGGSAETIKGTQSQKALKFKTKVMFMFLAVKIDLLNDANRSRIPIIEMRNQNATLKNDFDFAGMRRRTFENLARIPQLEDQTREYMQPFSFDHRTVDTYSVLIAGFWFLVSESDFLQDPNDKLNELAIKAIESIRKKQEEEEPEEVQILNQIFNHREKVSMNEELSVFEMLENHIKYKDVLSRIGIRRDVTLTIEGKQYNALAIVGNHDDIRKIMKGTEFEHYRQMLLRHPASIFDELKSTHMISAKHKQRCVIMDWKIIEKHHFVEDVQEALPF